MTDKQMNKWAANIVQAWVDEGGILTLYHCALSTIPEGATSEDVDKVVALVGERTDRIYHALQGEPK